MVQKRLKNTVILRVHKDCTDALKMVEVANEFVRNVKKHG